MFPGIILYKNAARDLNVGMNDIVTVRFETVYGQSQAPKFKVVGLIPSENMFMDVAAFVDQDTLRGMLNLKPDESLGLNIVTDVPGKRAEGHRRGQQAARRAGSRGCRRQGAASPRGTGGQWRTCSP